ncbi:4'-phosphopantetheinyl transferase [Photobacterium rosenbergii]|uniref:Enterobactin synthase component D n=1 Tax=Photobacterium rosenbergii TaxID=294936 RepID=A0ABU3ZML8_9GAMM|nr:4'-phosphopantetheinyl transferase superfamily protein [Photobacterium rosenbergii]MDV5171346.1 4'-phosphopantetheinyl transferase superfamily protein [Photobacterium rosenbergii]
MTFIYNRQELELPYLEAYCEVCQFETDRYQPSDFERYGVLCPEEIAGSVGKRQAEYLAGRYMAKSALQQLGFEDTQVGRGSLREPVWPHGVVGSISHSSGYAACVVASSDDPCAGIGLDIESLIKPDVYQNFTDVVISQGEKLKMKDANIEEDLFHTLLFSAKEAIFKALFQQVRRYFDFLDVSLTLIDHLSLCFRLNVDLGEKLPVGTQIKVYWMKQQSRIITYTHSQYIY